MIHNGADEAAAATSDARYRAMLKNQMRKKSAKRKSRAKGSKMAIQDLGSAGNTKLLSMPSGEVATFNLPKPTKGVSGIFKLSESPKSSPASPWYYEIQISKTPGVIEVDPSWPTPETQKKFTSKDGRYARSGNMTHFTKGWFNAVSTNHMFDTQAEIEASGNAFVPDSEGPWYINVRYTYAGYKSAGKVVPGVCGWGRAWSPGGY